MISRNGSCSKFTRSVYLLLAYCCWISTELQQVDADEINDLAKGINAAHEALLRYPQGVEIQFTYTIKIKDVPSTRRFGTMRCLWPRLYIRTEGDQIAGGATGPIVLKNHVRAANYDFELGTSLAHDGNMMAQLCNYRHSFSAKLALPIDMQYFIEADQLYDPTQVQESDFWLPNALNSGTYVVVRRETVDGISCVVIANDRDELSIADSRSFVILRRKFQSPELNELTRSEARDLREVAVGLYVPFEQTRIKSPLRDEGEAISSMTKLNVTDVILGKLEAHQLEVEIPKDVKEYEDYTKGVNFSRRDEGATGIAFRKIQIDAKQDMRSRWIRVALLGALAAGLFLGSFLIQRRRNAK